MKKRDICKLPAIIILTFVFIFPSLIFAQPEIKSGDVSFLLHEEKVNVQFDYSVWTFQRVKFSEEKYLARRTEGIKEDKGEEEVKVWLADWKDTKVYKIPTNFIENINKGIGTLEFGKGMNTKYTLIVRPIHIFPGSKSFFNAEPTRGEAEFIFIETGKPENILLKIEMEEMYGIGSSLVANRNKHIAALFITSGEIMGKFLKRELRKATK